MEKAFLEAKNVEGCIQVQHGSVELAITNRHVTGGKQVFIGTYIAKDGTYDLFMTAEHVKTEKYPWQLSPLLEAAIAMIDDDRSLGRDEIIRRLQKEVSK